MAVTYTWKNIKLSAHKNMYSQTDVVFLIDCELVGTELNRTETLPVKVAVSYEAGGSFTDINSVTKEQAIDWIESNLSATALQELKDKIQHEFDQFTKVTIGD